MYTHPSEHTQYILDRLTTHFVPGTLKAGYYSDQRLIPHFPAFTVESDNFERSLGGQASSHRFALILRTMIIVYHEKIQPGGTTLKSTETLAESIADYLNADPTLGGNVIFGFVGRMDPGIVVAPDRTMLRATRMSFESFSRETF